MDELLDVWARVCDLAAGAALDLALVLHQVELILDEVLRARDREVIELSVVDFWKVIRRCRDNSGFGGAGQQAGFRGVDAVSGRVALTGR